MTTADYPVHVIETPTDHGPIQFWGELTGRPVVLMILGAFEVKGAFRRVPQLLPDVDVLISHLPGNHCPWLEDMSLPALSAAYEAAIRAHIPRSPLLIAGVSTGALIALGIKAANVRSLLLIEPPLRPSRAWPLREYQTQGPVDRFRLMGPVFGVYADRVEPRDYASLLSSLDRATHVLLGDAPPEEPISFHDGMPSLVDRATREDLAAHAQVTVRHVPGVGHNVPGRAAQVVLEALRAGASKL